MKQYGSKEEMGQDGRPKERKAKGMDAEDPEEGIMIIGLILLALIYNEVSGGKLEKLLKE